MSFAKFVKRAPRSKFSAKPTRCQPANVMHQSGLEARRCSELQLMQLGGLIRDLEAHPQPEWSLDVNGVHVCNYRGDFRYFDIERDTLVVEDTKGVMTSECRLKLKLMAAVHGVDVELVRHAGKSRGWR